MTKEAWRHEFARVLKELMDEHNMSVEELSKEIYITPRTIYHYLRADIAPSPKAIVNIAITFDCSCNKLLDFGEPIDDI